MIDLVSYILCGVLAGFLGGYLGLGGGIIMVPYLTVIAGFDIKVAAPVSILAIVVNSFSATNEYLKKGMVDLELTIILSIFMVLGNIGGSLLSDVVPSGYTRLIFTVILVYAAFTFLKGKKPQERLTFSDNRTRYLMVCTVLAFAIGAISALVGIGGGVMLVPVLYLIIGLPLSTARGTSTLMIGISAAAATTVYFLKGEVDPTVATGVVLGIMVGGKFGGLLGTRAKPKLVKIIFFFVMLYLAFRLSYQPLMEILYDRKIF